MGGLTKTELRKFEDLADNSPVTILVIADSPAYEVLYGSNLNLLQYSDSEVRGKHLVELLPPEIADSHGKLMQKFKEEVNEGVAREMSSGRTIQAPTKSGDRLPVRIEILFIPVNARKGYFIAFLQDANLPPVDLPQLINLKGQVEILLGKIHSEFLHRVRLAGGGISGVILVITSIVTPLWPALNSARASFLAAMASNITPTTGQSVTVAASLTDRQRKLRLRAIRDQIRREDDTLIATAYYEFSERLDGLKLYWVADTETPNGSEVWFYDNKDRKLVLTIAESQSLLNQDCIFRQNGAALVNQPGQPKLNLVICPTVFIDQKDGLPQFHIKGLLVGAYDKSVTRLEPHGSTLWRFTPSVETTN